MRNTDKSFNNAINSLNLDNVDIQDLENMKKRSWNNISHSINLNSNAMTETVNQSKKRNFRWVRSVSLLIPALLIVSIIGLIFVNKLNTRKTELTYASSCEDLQKKFNEYTKNGRSGFDSLEKNTLATISDSAASVTKTNVQVSGIDESDIVKTDGKRLFTINQNNVNVNILSISPLNETKKVGEYKLDYYPNEMFLQDDLLIIFGNRYRDYLISNGRIDGSSSMVTILNISDLKNPKLVRTVQVEGSFNTARLKDNYVYLITNKGVYNGGIVPLYSENNGDAKKTCDCNDVAIIDPNYVYPNITTVTTLEIKGNNIESPKFNNFVGNASTVYVSNESIYFAGGTDNYIGGDVIMFDRSNSYEQKTKLSKLSYSKSDIKFVASIDIKGRLLNQFSLDEKDGYLRLARTESDVFNGNSSNFLDIYDDKLNKVSSINNLAKGEKIYSARFYGDLGVMVTFKKVDPLFVFDLSNPRNPILKGELKIPGYSDYLHFIDKNTIIGIGKDAVDASSSQESQKLIAPDNNFAYYQGIKIAIFDISNLSNPKELSNLILGDRGSQSEALGNHKAFVYDPNNNVLVVPAIIYKADDTCKEAFCYGKPVSQGAQIISTKDNKLIFLKEISHGPVMSEYSYYAPNSTEVHRSVIANKSIITISPSKVLVNSLSDFSLVKEITL